VPYITRYGKIAFPSLIPSATRHTDAERSRDTETPSASLQDCAIKQKQQCPVSGKSYCENPEVAAILATVKPNESSLPIDWMAANNQSRYGGQKRILDFENK
jgi:hypothetical protein